MHHGRKFLGHHNCLFSEWIGKVTVRHDQVSSNRIECVPTFYLVNTHDVVINCAGALQDGSNDSLKAVHYQAIKAIVDACALHETKLIQISAVGAELDADTEFMRTKAMGDAYIRDSKIDYVIFRPGLVLAKNAYGGSALLRMLAAFPLIQPIALSNTQIHSTSIDDLSAAVHMAVKDIHKDGNTPHLFITKIKL